MSLEAEKAWTRSYACGATWSLEGSGIRWSFLGAFGNVCSDSFGSGLFAVTMVNCWVCGDGWVGGGEDTRVSAWDWDWVCGSGRVGGGGGDTRVSDWDWDWVCGSGWVGGGGGDTRVSDWDWVCGSRVGGGGDTRASDWDWVCGSGWVGGGGGDTRVSDWDWVCGSRVGGGGDTRVSDWDWVCGSGQVGGGGGDTRVSDWVLGWDVDWAAATTESVATLGVAGVTGLQPGKHVPGFLNWSGSLRKR